MSETRVTRVLAIATLRSSHRKPWIWTVGEQFGGKPIQNQLRFVPRSRTDEEARWERA